MNIKAANAPKNRSLTRGRKVTMMPGSLGREVNPSEQSDSFRMSKNLKRTGAAVLGASGILAGLGFYNSGSLPLLVGSAIGGVASVGLLHSANSSAQRESFWDRAEEGLGEHPSVTLESDRGVFAGTSDGRLIEFEPGFSWSLSLQDQGNIEHFGMGRLMVLAVGGSDLMMTGRNSEGTEYKLGSFIPEEVDSVEYREEEGAFFFDAGENRYILKEDLKTFDESSLVPQRID